jgi:hypothetical protein
MPVKAKKPVARKPAAKKTGKKRPPSEWVKFLKAMKAERKDASLKQLLMTYGPMWKKLTPAEKKAFRALIPKWKKVTLKKVVVKKAAPKKKVVAKKVTVKKTAPKKKPAKKVAPKKKVPEKKVGLRSFKTKEGKTVRRMVYKSSTGTEFYKYKTAAGKMSRRYLKKK